ncbi:hypothetical protein F5146DRAFT_1146989 [Armillaria mellea]|nr:hypothetical protein F5146DRAFT_1146989 [Armillaria mellea]
MLSHPAIISIHRAFSKANIDIPVNIKDLNTKKEIKENDTVTHHDVEYASRIAVAIRGHFASSSSTDLTTMHKVKAITRMYKFAVERAYSNTTFFRDYAAPVVSQDEIEELQSKIRDLESKIALVSTRSEGDGLGGNLLEKIARVQTTAATAQITADNAQIAHQNSHRRYREEFSALRKVTAGSGFKLAKGVCPTHVKENSLKDATTEPQVGSIPPEFKGRIGKYSDMDILEMIIFYNNLFGIARSDVLSERINKFRSFLSDCEM